MGVLVMFSTRAIFCFQLTNVYRIYPNENSVNILFGGIRGDEMNFLALDRPWVGDFVIIILWSPIDVNHHTCVVK